MSLSLTINGVDFTSKWRLYESRWTARAYLGESSQSEFVIDDDAGNIDHADLASRKVVEVWEDASGSSVCMYRGRVANKTLGRGTLRTGLAMRWTVTAEDYNIDLRGIRVTDSHRPEESDRERVLAYMAAYLNGSSSFNSHARDTTELDGGFVVNADLVTLPTEDYADTFPAEVFSRICEISAKTFFVFVDDAGQGQLYYATHTDTSYSSDISITDDGTADGMDIFTPYFRPITGEHDGQRTITGGGVRYGEDEFYELSDVAGSEADHDKWEEHFTDEYLVNEGSAETFITNQVASRNNEDFTFVATIDMLAEDAHRIKAGMMVPVRMASADKPASTEQRAVQVTHEPRPVDEDGNARYGVTIEFGTPRGRPFRRNLRRRPTAKPVPSVCRDHAAFSSPLELLMKFRFRMAVTTQAHSLQLIISDTVSTAASLNVNINNASGAGFGNVMGIASLDLDDPLANNTDGPPTQAILITVDDVWCWMRLRADTTGQAMVKLWKDGDAEPGAWDVETDDAAVNWTSSDAANLNTLTFNPTLGTAASGSSLEIESMQFTDGFDGDSDTESFTRTEAAGLGISEWNGEAYGGRTTNLAVNGTQLVDTDDGSSAEYTLGFPAVVCTVGGPGATSGTSTSAAAADHDHDYPSGGPFVDSAGTAWKFDTGLDTIESEGGPGLSMLLVNDAEVMLSADNGDAYFYASENYAAIGATAAISFAIDDVKHYLNNGAGVVLPQIAADPAGGDSQDGQAYYNTVTDTFRGRKRGVWEDIGTPSYVSIAKWGD